MCLLLEERELTKATPGCRTQIVAFDPIFIFAVFNKMRFVAPQASRG
jgi:hypothetical protein